MDKPALRTAVLSRLRARTAAQRNADSARLRGMLRPFLGGAGLRVALYAPLPHEVDLLPLLHESPQHRYAFPRCRPGRGLTFHEVGDPSRELVPGAMGIPAPLPSLPAIAAADFELVIVPGVAFTGAGDRLGYGGGYYDRFLPCCRSARLVALAFAEQMLPDGSIPTEAHDLRLPCILHL